MNKKSVCLYLHVHQPWRLTKLNILEMGSKKDLFLGFGQNENKAIFQKVSAKSYIPTNKVLLQLIKKFPEFKVNFSISGTFLDQAVMYDNKVLKSFQQLVQTGNVELLNETYYHSLSWLYSKQEFVNQIKLHRSAIWKYFKRRPVFFRNTELIYNNEIANFVRLLGFDGVIAEGWEPCLNGKSPNLVYNAKKTSIHPEDKKIVEKETFTQKVNQKIKLLLKNYKLSDDIAFRFSNKSWEEYPLTPEKFADWIEEADGNIVNLFIDFETFGEHQWEDSGIYKFLKQLPKELLKRGITFKTLSETTKAYKTHGEIDIHEMISWADESRDLSAWTGNNVQDAALKAIYELEAKIMEVTKGKNNREEKDILLETWRRLQTSDHFYYMCTKYWADGDVHKYFSPYESPYYAYINYMNCFNDFVVRLEELESGTKFIIE